MDARRLGVVAALAVVVPVLLLAAWAATSGASLFVIDPPHVPRSPTSGAATLTATPTPTASPGTRHVSGGSPLLTLVGRALVVAALLALAIVTARALVRWRPRLPRRRRAAGEATPDRPGVRLDSGAGALAVEDRREALAAAGRALVTGGPRDGVVACWSALLDWAGGRGIATHDTDTARTIARALAANGSERGALDDLLRLYERARFSHHPVTEADRAAAAQALDRIRAATPAPPAPGASAGSAAAPAGAAPVDAARGTR